jgi:hypothetical protein
LERTQKDFGKLYPQAKKLTWFVMFYMLDVVYQLLMFTNRDDISLYAHESATKFSSIQHLNQNRTVKDIFDEFVSQRLGSASSLSSRMIEVRFAYQKDAMVRYLTVIQSLHF